MKNNRWLPMMWTAFVAVFLIALLSFVQQGRTYIGKNYEDTLDFKHILENFYENIGPLVLNPLNAEEMKKNIPVTQREIEEHRTRHGSLADQIADIQDQYEWLIVEAEGSKSKEVVEILKKERDTTMADIRKNFEDDAHVEAKVRAEKSRIVDEYMNNLPTSNLAGSPFHYKFTDVETGETYSSGDVDVSADYQRLFNEENGLFRTGSILTNGDYGHELVEITSRINWFPGRYDEVVSETKATTTDIQEMVPNTIRTYEGMVVLPKEALKEGNHAVQVSEYNQSKYLLYTLWIFGALAFILLLTKFRFDKNWVMEDRLLTYYNKLKIDTKIVFLLISFYATILSVYINADKYGYSYRFTSLDIWGGRVFNFGVLVLLLALTVFQLVNFVERWKQNGVVEHDIKNSYTLKFFSALQDLFLKKTIGVQTILLLIGFFLAGIGFVGVVLYPTLLLIYIPLVLIFALPILYILVSRSAYLNRIIVSTEAMAQGKLHESIKVEGKSPLASHAVSLNNLREGVRISMSEQAKSERLKTELITNVSHDLRTPLTSIITYTDLLKKEDLSDEDRAKYIDVIDKKSLRLKTLIEDLFEVSKMASGNLELHRQRVDLTQLLQQAFAEHEGEISKTGLDFRMSLPEKPLTAYVDGKRWWRVLDNLIVNAIKYALPGTRVYITLRDIDGNAEFVVKNITKYELGENVDELFERFKRADTSRHTDGSGLGLAIAQSIVDMHEGRMEIEVDGDLFKVTVAVPTIY